jgi:DNA repair protein RadC
MHEEGEVAAALRDDLRERAARDGVDGLGAGELFELVVGRPKSRVGRLETGLAGWSRASARCLEVELGLSRLEALRLAAAFELGRRVEGARRPGRPLMRSAESVWRHLATQIRGCDRERFHVLLLDGKHRLIRAEAVSEGTLTTSLVHPREVFRPAVREAAAAVVVAHNHPSGDPEPSEEDLEVTRRLLHTGRLLGIPLLDHVVMGERAWVSLRERMVFTEPGTRTSTSAR